jgi:Mg2+ and Co2+ transporter CorA
VVSFFASPGARRAMFGFRRGKIHAHQLRRVRGREKIAEFQPRKIHSYVNRPECFVWVAMFEPTDEELAAMRAEFNLHDLVVEEPRHGHQRPKIEQYGGLLFAVVQKFEGNLRLPLSNFIFHFGFFIFLRVLCAFAVKSSLCAKETPRC